MKATYKYIFVVGAPGSKWSSVTKNIYFSPDIDQTDYSEERTYWHDAPGTLELMHTGAYFDPGMEFGEFFDQLDQYSKEQCEAEFNRPFSGSGIRIIKSHVFAKHIDFIKKTWPECPIVVCYRNNDECLGWWVKCGHFTITYPLYHKYYKDLREMAKIIAQQNSDILEASKNYIGIGVSDNVALCQMLNIAVPSEEYRQDYTKTDVKVTLI